MSQITNNDALINPFIQLNTNKPLKPPEYFLIVNLSVLYFYIYLIDNVECDTEAEKAVSTRVLTFTTTHST